MDELHPSDPRQVGSYRLLGRLGSGGMGQVFVGESPGGRLVAVKVIRPDLADDPDFRRRFAREVAAARRVSGVFTAPVVDADPEAPQPWLVTAYVDGPSLSSHVGHGGAMPEGDVIWLGRALAEGLAAIHAAGIVHRDLKPSNVLLASDGPRIIDFGISRAAETTYLTQTGRVVGSPGFMSPEQAEGREVNPASDVFSLGAVLTFAATGEEPFGSGAAAVLLYRVVHAEPALTGVSADLGNVLSACLQKHPADRPTPDRLMVMLASLSDEQQLPTVPVNIGSRSVQSGDAGGLRAQQTFARTGLRSGTVPAISVPATPAPATAGTAPLGSVLAAEVTPRRRRGPWITAGAAIALIAGAAVVLATHSFGTAKSPPRAVSPGATPTTTAEPTPGAVVEAYFAAINARNWHQVWQLGGKNLSPSYAGMVTGFQHTSRDVITRMTSHGDAVTVRLRAYETTGRLQVYIDNYTVTGGVIASGHQTLLST